MKPFNVCLIQPTGFIHSGAFDELALLVFFALNELGYAVTFNKNKIDGAARNILVGTHLVPLEQMRSLPRDTIIINTEPISITPSKWRDVIHEGLIGHLEMWDYDERNIDYLRAHGFDRIKKLKIGFQRELRRIDNSALPEVDVLFYGSLNQRRLAVLGGIEKNGHDLKMLYGVYGGERDRWIGNSKLVLNCHYYDTHIFEIVRVFYLLTNSVAVVGEVNPTTSIDSWIRDAIAAVPYDQLVDKVQELLDDPATLAGYRKLGLELISQFPQSAYMRELLS